MSASSTPSSSTRPGPTQPPPAFGSIFQSPGGPPLILVCIAAGLLLGAFIGVLLMRRMRPRVVVQRVNGGRLAGLQFKLGEKPKLLDIHLVPRSEGLEGGMYGEAGIGSGATGPGGYGTGEGPRWAHVFPFAAMYLSLSDSSSHSAPGQFSSSPSSSSASNSNFNTSVDRVWRLLARLRRSSPRPAHDPHASFTSSSPPLRQVQLAVTVSMPSPHHPQYVRPTHTSTPNSASVLVSSPSSASEKTASNRDDPHIRTHDSHADPEDSMPDCCIGTVVVQYRPPPDADSLSPPSVLTPAPSPVPVPGTVP